jgi:CRP-like cAMP-binding protein
MPQLQSLWYLENIDVSGLFCPKKEQMGMREHLPHRSYLRGEHIYVPMDEADRIFFISAGRVKIGTRNDDGKEVTKSLLGPGELFGELCLVGETERLDFAEAIEATELCVMQQSQLLGLMRERNDLHLFFLQIIGSRVLAMERRLESLVFKDSRTRIIEFLVDLTERKGRQVGYEREVRRFLTHQEIANLTATSRQTVTTTLNELRGENLISFNRRRLLVRDLEALARAASPKEDRRQLK